MNTEQLIAVIHQIAEKIEAEKAFLTELDNVIGDGDHGINLARGFGEVEKKLDSLKDKEPGDVLKSVGMTLVSTVGGASGPLYGTGFMKIPSRSPTSWRASSRPLRGLCSGAAPPRAKRPCWTP